MRIRIKNYREKLNDWLWSSNWYPWLWDHTYGPPFRLYSRWKFKRDLAEMYGGKIPEAGDIVCNCRYEHLPIRSRDGDNVVLENGTEWGYCCSLWNCCSPADHEWAHPSKEELKQFYEETKREIDEYEQTRKALDDRHTAGASIP